MRKYVTPDGKPVDLPRLRDTAMAFARKRFAAAPPRPAAGAGRIPTGCRFAILRSPLDKPTVFADLKALARRVHRDRAGAAIQMVNATLYIPGEATGRSVAKIVTLCEGAPHRDLGYAWVAMPNPQGMP